MSKLYTTQILALAAEMANYPLRDGFVRVADARSRTCGSTITLGIDLDDQGRVRDIGMRVAACAIGQGSAAILAGGIRGASAQDIRTTHKAVKSWLAGEGELPQWPRMEALAPALEHPGRHGALLLGWEAVSNALQNAGAPIT